MWGYGSNDVYDFDTGVDKDKKESVVNLVGRWVYLKLVFVFCLFFFWFDKKNNLACLFLMLNLESRTGTFVAAYLCLALGSVGLTWTAVNAGSTRSILLLTCAIICGYIYQVKVFANIRIMLESYSESYANFQIPWLIHCCCSVHHFG